MVLGLAVELEGVTTVRVTVEEGLLEVVAPGLVTMLVLDVMVGLVVVGVASVLEEETLVAGLVVVVVGLVVTGLLVVGVASVLAEDTLPVTGLVVPVLPVLVGCAVMLDGLFKVLASVRAPVTVGVTVAELLLPLLLKELPVPVVPATRLS